jgi:spermidine synthase
MPLTAYLMTFNNWFGLLVLLNITSISGFLGCIFPLLCHITVASNEANVGKQTSWLYAANIIGATAGPLLTGYVLVDVFPTKIIVTIFCVLPALVAVVLNLKRFALRSSKLFVSAGIIVALVAILANGFVYYHFFERVGFGKKYTKNTQFVKQVENRNGIISVLRSGNQDYFYGGGAYDGNMNTNPENDVNMIKRAYMVSALHPNPKRVMMVGLSTGSWAKVLADFESIDELVVVEINPGYMQLIASYPEVKSILTNKKVKIIIDDGRRWLKRNSHEKFDMVVMNTTWHWREHMTNLLSAEFIQICKNVLRPGGVMYWNSTWSPVVLSTAASQFKYVTTYFNFVAGSDAPFTMNYTERKNALLKFTANGQPIFSGSIAREKLLDDLATIDLSDKKDSIAKLSTTVITDNNMASEYKVRIYPLHW